MKFVNNANQPNQTMSGKRENVFKTIKAKTSFRGSNRTNFRQIAVDSVVVLGLFSLYRRGISLQVWLLDVVGLPAWERAVLFEHLSDAEVVDFEILETDFNVAEEKWSCHVDIHRRFVDKGLVHLIDHTRFIHRWNFH